MALSLINQDTGEPDLLAIAEASVLRACSEYGSPNPPPVYRRQAEQYVLERAQTMRRGWRRDHNLPDDSAVTMVALPAWGASGDSFGGAR